MNYRGMITTQMASLMDVLAPYCADRETLDWLRAAVSDRSKWQKADGVFNHIRNKLLKAERAADSTAVMQYRFEEICAKTLFNLTNPSAPFDADSPYWVVPNAITFAQSVSVNVESILECVIGNRQ
jgi:hypothetical protein